MPKSTQLLSAFQGPQREAVGRSRKSMFEDLISIDTSVSLCPIVEKESFHLSGLVTGQQMTKSRYLRCFFRGR